MSYTLTPSRPQKLHDAATVSAQGGILYIMGHCERLTVVVQGTGTTSGGTIQIEEAYYDKDFGRDPVYGGTWSAVGAVINASTVTGGAQSVVHVVGSFWAVRVRIVTDITGGGSITVWAWGN